jgi:hypothetical protein
MIIRHWRIDVQGVATDGAFLSVAFSLDARPPVNCGGNGGARAPITNMDSQDIQDCFVRVLYPVHPVHPCE